MLRWDDNESYEDQVTENEYLNMKSGENIPLVDFLLPCDVNPSVRSSVVACQHHTWINPSIADVSSQGTSEDVISSSADYLLPKQI